MVIVSKCFSFEQAYNKEVSDLKELREKRKQALQAELRTLNQSVAAT
jgi:hypothetical protein